jgi:gluconate 2-dehydrogenase gamma chain
VRPSLNRRQAIAGAVTALVVKSEAARATIVKGELPFQAGTTSPPDAAEPGEWLFFTDEEAATVEAIVDRLIPADDLSPGGKELGCAVFIDRQVSGPYGHLGGYYMAGPFVKGAEQQGPQSETTPAEVYRRGVAALDDHCKQALGSRFSELSDAQKDSVIKSLEDGQVNIADFRGQEFFALVLKDARMGFFADPAYGGNKDMASWRMIGFPGARYDYREWIGRHNQAIALPPVPIKGRRKV